MLEYKRNILSVKKKVLLNGWVGLWSHDTALLVLLFIANIQNQVGSVTFFGETWENELILLQNFPTLGPHVKNLIRLYMQIDKINNQYQIWQGHYKYSDITL